MAIKSHVWFALRKESSKKSYFLGLSHCCKVVNFGGDSLKNHFQLVRPSQNYSLPPFLAGG